MIESEIMRHPASIALMIIFIDAIGLGLIMPVLPSLLGEFLPTETIPNHYGVLLALYAVMQVVFAPILGKISDAFGRRPVLLITLIGATLDYLFLAFSSSLWMLYIGRIISGITGATSAVSASIIADTTTTDERTKWFGRMGASYGLGLMIGPIIGGIAGDFFVHLPFFISAFINLIIFVIVFIYFKETLSHTKTDAESKGIENPSFNTPKINFYRNLLQKFGIVLLLYFTVQLIGQIPATTWVLFTKHRFDWEHMTVGLSLAGLGLMHALFQAFLTGPISNKWGEEITIISGFIADSLAFIALAFITQSIFIAPILILLAGGGIALPALQSLISKSVSKDYQGRLQGILVSLTNITSIIGPILFAFIYSQTLNYWDGWIWIIGALLYFIAIILYIVFRVLNRHYLHPKPE